MLGRNESASSDYCLLLPFLLILPVFHLKTTDFQPCPEYPCKVGILASVLSPVMPGIRIALVSFFQFIAYFSTSIDNKGVSEIAVSASSSEIHIFEWKNGDWINVHTLTDHDLPVTGIPYPFFSKMEFKGIDWAPKTNRIVSCSQDKNAFVWTFDKGVWKPELVLVKNAVFGFGPSCIKLAFIDNYFYLCCANIIQ